MIRLLPEPETPSADRRMLRRAVFPVREHQKPDPVRLGIALVGSAPKAVFGIHSKVQAIDKNGLLLVGGKVLPIHRCIP
jgi:hypothetical protein